MLMPDLAIINNQKLNTMKNTLEISEKAIKIEVFNFNKEVGYLNDQKVSLRKKKDENGYIEYPSIQTLELTTKQEKLLLAFINSL
jgi:hypothetical protein